MIGEISQTQKDTYCGITLTGGTQNRKINRDSCQRMEKGEWGACLRGTEFVFGMMIKFWIYWW
jgi:hypothetical protein